MLSKEMKGLGETAGNSVITHVTMPAASIEEIVMKSFELFLQVNNNVISN